MSARTNGLLMDFSDFHRALHAWYAVHGRRDLPWRKSHDPYHVYVSEIMLQQTQVKTVLDRYYVPFLKRFPTLAALAKTDTEAVVKQWEGLGYYTRARNLHAAAQQSGGKLPSTVEGLLALPGIGRNTAHAVACFGFGIKVPVMEANVRRVLCRIFAMETADEAVLWQRAGELLDKANAFDYNQAMMDIGSMVCTRRNPRCGECPASPICKGKSAPELYPAPKASKATPVRERVIVVFEGQGGEFYLQRRDTRFLGGLYGFAEYETGSRSVTFLGQRHRLADKQLLGQVRQVYSHFTLQAKVYRVKLKKPSSLPEGMQAATLAAISHLPLSGADHKILRLLKDSC